ncbi:transcriptional regulator [Enterobacter sp. EA-1]|nr:transcriptional regulator [Enterobacter sp. EA-1]
MEHQDWHPADIIAGLRKKGHRWRRFPVNRGWLHPLANALTRHWPKGERLIAEALDTRPEVIWPSRYPGCKSDQGSV